MSPNSRPPLTSRIRASFEGKRTKSEVTSPVTTNGFITQDPESFRSAIDAAINSESFQNAIAANLALIIKPSIKDALDTLQPLVESVYSHEVLLRKTNKSVENILLRIETNNARNGGEITPRSPGSPGTPTTPRRRGSTDSSAPQDVEQFRLSLEKNNKRTVATLAELSNAVDSNNKKIQEVVVGIGGLQATLAPTNDNLDSLKSHSEQSITTTAVLQAQLDQLKSDIGSVMEAVGSGLGKNVHYLNQQVADRHILETTNSTKLKELSTDVKALKGQGDISNTLEALSADFETLRSLIESSTNSSKDNFTALGSQVELVQSAVEAHGGLLSEISVSKDGPELLAAVRQSNESHASHTVMLGEIREVLLRPGSEPVATSSDKSESLDALQALKSDLAALGENIEIGQSSHSHSLNDIRSRVDEVLSVVETSHSSDRSAEILAAVQQSNQSHISHAETLAGIKSTAMDTSPSAPDHNASFAALEAQGAEILAGVQKSNENHTLHAKTIDELVSTVHAPTTPVSYDSDFVTLGEKIAALHTTMEAHSGSLEDIKLANVSTSREIVPVEAESNNLGDLQTEISAVIDKLDKQTELLSELKDDVSAEILTALHDVGQAQSRHSTLLAEIREADVSDEILTALHSSIDAHASHSADLEELKFNRDATPPASAAEAGSEVSEAQLAALAASLEEHKSILLDIKDAAHASNESHSAHASSLDEIRNKAVEATPATHSGTETLEAQIGSVIASLDQQLATLADIKNATESSNEFHTAHASSLDTIREETIASNNHHLSHTSALEQLKSIPLAQPSATESRDTSALEAQIGSIITSLEAHQATLNTIENGIAASHELHASQAATLVEVKESTGDLSGLTSTQSALLEEIKANTTALNESGSLHTTTLDEIKEGTFMANQSHTAHAAELAELKAAASRDVPAADVPSNPDASALEPHLTSIINTLEVQNQSLAKIEELAVAADVLSILRENQHTIISNHDLLNSHTTLLETIQAEQSKEIVLSTLFELRMSAEASKTGIDAQGALVKNLQDEMKSSHTALITSFGSSALGAASGAALVSSNDDNKSTEILGEVKAVRALIESSSASVETTKDTVTSIASQIEINHTTVTTSVTTLSDELKAEIDASGTQLTDCVTALNGDLHAINMTTVTSAVNGFATEIKRLSIVVEDLDDQIHTTGAKVDTIADGVHFNDRGIDQIKEHTKSTDVAPSMSEGAWFKKSSLPEPSDDEEREYSYLSPVPEESSPTSEDALPLKDIARANDFEQEANEHTPDDVSAAEVPQAPSVERGVEETPELVETENAIKSHPDLDTEEALPEASTKVEDDLVDDEQSVHSHAAKEDKHVHEVTPTGSEELVAASNSPVAEEKSETEPESAQVEGGHESDMEEPAPRVDNDALHDHTLLDDIEDNTGHDPDTPVEPLPAASMDVDNEEVHEADKGTVPASPIEEDISEEKDGGGPAHDDLVTEADVKDLQEDKLVDANSTAAEPDLEASSSHNKYREKNPAPLTPVAPTTTEADQFDLVSPAGALPSSPTESELETPSASTSAFASPSGPLSPLSPTGGGKKGKKGKKEKKEKAPKKKKEKVPFSMDGDEPDEE
jgi:hypothetical protein